MQRRSAEEVRDLVRGYEESGLARREYCRRLGIPVTTFDYYRQGEGRRTAAKRKARAAVGRVVEVKLETEAAPLAAFALVLRNGRRIEGAWGFADGDLARLIRVAEGA